MGANMEVAMAVKRLATCAALSSLVINSALAASATGRITYMASDGHQLMLDNSDMYAVGPAVDLSSVGVADRVKVDWDRQGGENVITRMVKAPLTPSSPSRG